MNAAWFAILALMLTAYAVLDGFDFGAGIVHTFVARTDAERRTVLAAIGPLWGGTRSGSWRREGCSSSPSRACTLRRSAACTWP